MPTGYEKPTVTPLYGDQAMEPEKIAVVLVGIAVAVAVVYLEAWIW